MTDTLTIHVNAEPHKVTSATLAALLGELGFTSPAIATALNGDFVARDKRPDTMLCNGDRVEILAPMQGG